MSGHLAASYFIGRARNPEIKKTGNNFGRKIFFETYNCPRKEKIRTEVTSCRKNQGISLLHISFPD
ncbi:hypothetical protein A9239_10225 [Methanosarcina sp. A14]|nr:hypothetical protein A9239_10225 [Methanosarcina sp. A14]